jgi:diguanylate cyclase (GGDEF)-like protein
MADGARSLRGRIAIACAAGGLLAAALGLAIALRESRDGTAALAAIQNTMLAGSHTRYAAEAWQRVDELLREAPRGTVSQLSDEMVALYAEVGEELRAAQNQTQDPQIAAAAGVALETLRACNLTRLLGQQTVFQSPLDHCDSLFSDSILRLMDVIGGVLRQGFRQADDGLTHEWQQTMLLSALVVLVGLLAGRHLSKAILLPVAEAARAAEAIAAGDLRTAIPAGERNELGALLRAMVRMRDGIGEMVRAETGRRRDASASLDVALQSMAQGFTAFGPDRRLRLVNRRFYELYEVQAEALPTGVPLDVVQSVLADGGWDRAFAAAEAPGASLSTVERSWDGRTIFIDRRPAADGGWIATHEDITERRRNEAQIAFMVWHDALTRLPNRTLLEERMAEAVARLDGGDGFAIACIDLDGFKTVNETAGDTVGDALLCAVAARLTACVRETDTVARLGSDEFAVIQTGVTQPRDTARLAERILEALARPFALGGRELQLSATIGASLAPQDGSAADALLRQARTALHRAKREGGRTVRFFEAQTDAWLQQRRAMELDLRAALTAQEFELAFQPVFDLHSNSVTSAEALLRWRHPSRGMVAPGEFIPVCEETGLITPIGGWVLQAATRAAMGWDMKLGVAVNVSALQFRAGRLLEQVDAALAESGLPAERLELEITESTLLTDNASTLATLHALRGRGVRVALDDFGTGYSSLRYLRSFPFDRIKIDQSFVRDLGTSRDALAIVRAIAGLSGALGMRTTAEGVETAEQLEWLRREGCSEIQGYFISRPLSADAFARHASGWALPQVT